MDFCRMFGDRIIRALSVADMATTDPVVAHYAEISHVAEY